MTNAISAKDISVRFRPYVDKNPTLRRSVGRLQHRVAQEVVALDGVTFDVRRGEAFGVIGRNGAGKSTLMRVLARTLRPDSGTVTVNGRTSTLLQLGVGFKGELSGARNIYLSALASGMRRKQIDERFDSIVDFAELGDDIGRPLKGYSSGMHSRLAFSIAMHLDPDILLLDEVLAVGDTKFQEKSIARLTELLEKSGTIIFVSHSMPRVAEFCDRAMWLDRGKVQAVGEAGEITERYLGK